MDRRVYISDEFPVTLESIADAVNKGFGALGGPEHILGGKQTILVKPNLATARNHEKATTNPVVIEAVIAYLLEHDVKTVVLGEGAGGPQDTEPIFEATGVSQVARKYGIPLVDLNKADRVSVPVPDGVLHREIRMARIAAESDLVVNIPTMKTHHGTTISIAMKNLKGVLPWPTKRSFHQTGLFDSIVDLNRVLPNQLVVVDATRAMEGAGPFDGTPVPVNRIVMARDTVAADVVCARIMGFLLEDVPTIQAAKKANLGVWNPVVIGQSIEQVRQSIGRPFEKPCTADEMDFPYATVLSGDKTCTGCYEQIYGVCEIVSHLPWLTDKVSITFCVGNASLATLEGTEPVMIYGRCAIQEAERAGVVDGGRYVFASGCPPDPVTLREAFERVRRIVQA